MNRFVGFAFALFALQLFGTTECRAEIPAKREKVRTIFIPFLWKQRDIFANAFQYS